MPRLTDQEKADILRLLEADKPLPDKYRFLLFDDKREVELVWNGKTAEVCNVVLPFQVIEQVDEPRVEGGQAKRADAVQHGRARPAACRVDEQAHLGRQQAHSLQPQERPAARGDRSAGGIKLIYIDPPFDVGADFSMDIEIGDDTFTKRPNILEEIAYRDTWGKGADSFISHDLRAAYSDARFAGRGREHFRALRLAQ